MLERLVAGAIAAVVALNSTSCTDSRYQRSDQEMQRIEHIFPHDYIGTAFTPFTVEELVGLKDRGFSASQVSSIGNAYRITNNLFPKQIIMPVLHYVDGLSVSPDQAALFFEVSRMVPDLEGVKHLRTKGCKLEDIAVFFEKCGYRRPSAAIVDRFLEQGYVLRDVTSIAPHLVERAFFNPTFLVQEFTKRKIPAQKIDTFFDTFHFGGTFVRDEVLATNIGDVLDSGIPMDDFLRYAKALNAGLRASKTIQRQESTEVHFGVIAHPSFYGLLKEFNVPDEDITKFMQRFEADRGFFGVEVTEAQAGYFRACMSMGYSLREARGFESGSPNIFWNNPIPLKDIRAFRTLGLRDFMDIATLSGHDTPVAFAERVLQAVPSIAANDIASAHMRGVVIDDTTSGKYARIKDFASFGSTNYVGVIDESVLRTVHEQFGIRFFERYEAQSILTLSKIARGEYDFRGKHVVFALSSYADWNGAISNAPQRMIEYLGGRNFLLEDEGGDPEEAKNTVIVFYEGQSERDFVRAIGHFEQKCGQKILDAYIDAHGNESHAVLGFGEGDESSIDTTDADVFRPLRASFAPDARIYLISCSTGKGDNPLGSVMAQSLGIHVIAPKANVVFKGAEVDDGRLKVHYLSAESEDDPAVTFKPGE